MIEMLQASFFTTAEEICNQLLKRDQVTLGKLKNLTGRVIAIDCSLPDLTLYLLPNQDGIQIQSIYNDTPDTTLSGNLTDFVQLLTTEEKSDAMFGKTIQISGDSTLATQFQSIVAGAKIDWELLLGDIIGDLPAHQIALYAAWKAQFYKDTGESLLMNLNEFIKEEARLLPTRPEIDLFYDEVEGLQERVDRLAARLSEKAATKTA